jgi:hypothetical protein
LFLFPQQKEFYFHCKGNAIETGGYLIKVLEERLVIPGVKGKKDMVYVVDKRSSGQIIFFAYKKAFV